MAFAKYITVLCLIALANGQAQAPSSVSSEELEQAVTEGVDYLANQVGPHIQAARALQAAIDGGNLTEAQEAYRQSRRYYEEIELLAYGFPNVDSDLDARPYSFPEGEASDESPLDAESGSIFMGIHKIEALLFRDLNISGAVDYAARYVNSSQQLREALQNRDNFNAVGQWGGMIAEGTEIAGKKISSEEETFSDLSVLILYHNFRGIQAVYTPFANMVQTADPATAAIVDDALAAGLASVSPYIPYIGSSEAPLPYSFITVQQRAPIQAAGYTISSALRQAAAALGVEVDNEDDDDDDCKPTVTAAAIAAADPQIQNGLDYFKALLPIQQEAAANLTAAITAQDLGAARLAYLRMRPFYEQIEVLANSYLQIDSDIDAREYAFPYGEKDADFKGNHRLEALLFRDGDVGPQALSYAQGLQASFTQLDNVYAESSTDDEVFNPTNNFGGVIALATEIIAKKISSEEEKYSDHSWLIFYNNYKGIYSQALPFYDESVADLQAELEEAVQAAIACMPVETQDNITDVDVSQNAADYAERLASANYQLYSQATIEEKHCLTVEGYRVREILVESAAALNLFDDCSDYYTPGSGAPAPAVSTASAGSR